MRGSIKQRSKGSWTIVVDAGRDPITGKRKQHSMTVRGRKADAEKKMGELIAAIERGVDFDAQRQTLREYLDRWLDDIGASVGTEAGVKQRTFEGYRQIVQRHIPASLDGVPVGDVRLAKLKPTHLKAIYKRARERGLSERTVLHIHRLLFAALRQAVRDEILERNVAEAVDAPSPRSHKVGWLSPDEVRSLQRAVASTDLETPVALAVGAGMRLGEVLGLRWSDVDLDTATVEIRQTISLDGRFETPKSHRSERAIPLLPSTVAVLKQQRKAQAERRLLIGEAWQDYDLVCDRGDGRPHDPRNISRRFSALAKSLGLKVTFHGLRHTYASLMHRSGVDLKVISGLLGHSTLAITADIYTHVGEEVDRTATAALHALLEGRAGTER